MDSSAVLLSALTIVASCVALLGWVIKYVFTEMLRELKEVKVALNKQTTAIGIQTATAKSSHSAQLEIFKQIKSAVVRIQELHS